MREARESQERVTHSRRSEQFGRKVWDDHVESVFARLGQISFPGRFGSSIRARVQRFCTVDELVHDQALVLLPMVLPASGMASFQVTSNETKELYSPGGLNGVNQSSSGEVHRRARIKLESGRAGFLEVLETLLELLRP